MPIFVSKYYGNITEYSAEMGEYSERGEVFYNTPFTFRELVEEMEQWNYSPSDYPCRYNSWLEVQSVPNFTTGDYTVYSLHPCLTNDKRTNDQTLRYWEKALRAANFLK